MSLAKWLAYSESNALYPAVSLLTLEAASREHKTHPAGNSNIWDELKLELGDGVHHPDDRDSGTKDKNLHRYRVAMKYDNITSLFVNNPTDSRFRIYFIHEHVIHNEIITFYDILPGPNIFELFKNTYPRFLTPYIVVYLYVRKTDGETNDKYTPCEYLSNEWKERRIEGVESDEDTKLEVKIRGELMPNEEMTARCKKDFSFVVVDDKYGVHVVNEGGLHYRGHFFGDKVTEIRNAEAN